MTTTMKTAAALALGSLALPTVASAAPVERASSTALVKSEPGKIAMMRASVPQGDSALRGASRSTTIIAALGVAAVIAAIIIIASRSN